MTELSPLATVPHPVKLRIEDFVLLDQAGAFSDYAKSELIEGEILVMNAQHRPHARVKTRLIIAFAGALRGIDTSLEVLGEASVAIPGHSLPEPDIVLTSEPQGSGFIPLPSVALVVEVADTTLAHDLQRKARLYARAAIAEYWVADVEGRILHQLWMPETEGYAANRQWPFGGCVRAETIDGLAIDTSSL
ncbi:MAG: hypothetical protein A4S12_11160 [Proteobacteria bacterium SG_bin5]|nr:Uma2 family endonuclease [Sphingomonas sp.]OQW39724.1 MAG: hypothetical protein A4S12_11160 [Proteobacteria bacterium SG_bin5]